MTSGFYIQFWGSIENRSLFRAETARNHVENS